MRLCQIVCKEGKVMKKYLSKVLLLLCVCVLAVLAGVHYISPARCTGPWEEQVDFEEFYSQYSEFEYGTNRYGKMIFLRPRQAKNKIMELGFQAPLDKIKDQCGLDFEAKDWKSLCGYLHCTETSGQFSADEERLFAFLNVAVEIYDHSAWPSYELAELFTLKNRT